MERQKVLIVDDDPININIVEEMIGNQYDTKATLSGEDALHELMGFKPDVILLDVMMSGMSGYELCEKIREDKRLKDTIVIFLSARAMETDKRKGLEVGGNKYLTKPFSEEDLKKNIEETVKH